MTSAQPGTGLAPADAIQDGKEPGSEPCNFTSRQYRWLIEEGILATDHKVELIEGEIRNMPPMGDNHGIALSRLNIWLVRHAGEDYFPQCQVTIHLSEGFTPDPDFTLLRYHEGIFQADQRRGPQDVLLAIEIADSSLQHDLEEKSVSYARAGVPELWVVDIPHRQVHQLTQPSPGGYQARNIAEEEDTISPGLIPGLEMPVREALPDPAP